MAAVLNNFSYKFAFTFCGFLVLIIAVSFLVTTRVEKGSQCLHIQLTRIHPYHTPGGITQT